MNITSKSRYAVKIMLDLAQHYDEPRVQRDEIVRRQGVPRNYLDQLMLRLRRNGLVSSVRGRTGGYRLSRPPEEISMWDLLAAVEDSVFPVVCLEFNQACGFEGTCASEHAWRRTFSVMTEPLKSLTLASLASEISMVGGEVRSGGFVECRSGQRPARRLQS